MSYRRDKKKALKWETWLARHHRALLACAVPHVMLEDERKWVYFVEHGYFTPPGSAEAVINIDRMDRNQAERLCVLLESDDDYHTCTTLNTLQYRLKRGRHAQRPD